MDRSNRVMKRCWALKAGSVPRVQNHRSCQFLLRRLGEWPGAKLLRIHFRATMQASDPSQPNDARSNSASATPPDENETILGRTGGESIIRITYLPTGSSP